MYSSVDPDQAAHNEHSYLGLHFFYAPNFEKVEGAYCFGLVHLSLRPFKKKLGF